MTEHNFLTGLNLRIRAMEPEDADLLYEWENDTSIWRVSNTLVPFSKSRLRAFVMNTPGDLFSDHQLRLMIDHTPPDGPQETIGAVDLFDFDPVHLRAGIGILIQQEHRKRGFANEALTLLIRYSFDVLHLHQLYCNISPDNEASLRLFEKAGFNRCGIKKDWINEGNSWKDEWIFQLIS
ncbi:MAG: GNAT family N-acetyltransferase [Bacteroidales bacterium]|jgi:diamine N-acetyltransferase|nr:GNAT family N-acetyltransferase [Bacteroidales bacterium]